MLVMNSVGIQHPSYRRVRRQDFCEMPPQMYCQQDDGAEKPLAGATSLLQHNDWRFFRWRWRLRRWQVKALASTPRIWAEPLAPSMQWCTSVYPPMAKWGSETGLSVGSSWASSPGVCCVENERDPDSRGRQDLSSEHWFLISLCAQWHGHTHKHRCLNNWLGN